MWLSSSLSGRPSHFVFLLAALNKMNKLGMEAFRNVPNSLETDAEYLKSPNSTAPQMAPEECLHPRARMQLHQPSFCPGVSRLGHLSASR